MRALAAARRSADWMELQSVFARLIDVVLIVMGAAWSHRIAPHAKAHDDYYQKIVGEHIHHYRIKLESTGRAQVNGFRCETDRLEKMQGHVEYDMYYLIN